MQYFRLKDRVAGDDTNDAERKELLKALLWSKKSKQDMMCSLGMTPEHFQMIIGKLKKAKFLTEDNDIWPRFIPNKMPDDKRFMLQIVYDWSSQSAPIKNEA